ncbi:unnamed protein product [Schistosoma bovis]|nr:unnamed protein product [Schistosoma bovis]
MSFITKLLGVISPFSIDWSYRKLVRKTTSAPSMVKQGCTKRLHIYLFSISQRGRPVFLSEFGAGCGGSSGNRDLCWHLTSSSEVLKR